MTELTTSGNEIAKLMLQALAPTLHGAHIGENECRSSLYEYSPRNIRAGLFDSHSLFADMFARPQLYLNGTAPLNVTGAVHACVFRLNESTSDPGVCTDATGTDQDSFLW